MIERDALLAALEWQLAAGVDEVVGFEPTNRLAPPPERKAPTLPAPRVATMPVYPESVPAQDLAGVCDLDALRALLLDFDGCALKKTATNTVFGEGPVGARLMIIGEAPGADEDRQGRPFVGPSGRLLEQMLAAIGLAREEVYIANTVYWRPPGNRTPSAEEVEACRPFVDRQIALVGPEVLMLAGGAAAKTLLGATEGIMRLRGRWRILAGQGGPVDAMPTFHPAFLLRSPARKREAWLDLLAIRARLESAHP